VKILDLAVSATKVLDRDSIVIDGGKEKMIITVDPMEPPQYILSRVDARGMMVVVEYGELTNEGRKQKGGRRD